MLLRLCKTLEFAGLGNVAAAAVVVGLVVPTRSMAGRHPWLSLEGPELPIMCSLLRLLGLLGDAEVAEHGSKGGIAVVD